LCPKCEICVLRRRVLLCALFPEVSDPIACEFWFRNWMFSVCRLLCSVGISCVPNSVSVHRKPPQFRRVWLLLLQSVAHWARQPTTFCTFLVRVVPIFFQHKCAWLCLSCSYDIRSDPLSESSIALAQFALFIRWFGPLDSGCINRVRVCFFDIGMEHGSQRCCQVQSSLQHFRVLLRSTYVPTVQHIESLTHSLSPRIHAQMVPRIHHSSRGRATHDRLSRRLLPTAVCQRSAVVRSDVSRQPRTHRARAYLAHAKRRLLVQAPGAGRSRVYR
jgi:hypothetical protein